MTVQEPTLKRTYVRRGERAVTSAFLADRADALAVYTLLVALGSSEPSKEELILKYVNEFKQLSTKQIKALVYPGQPHEPQRRAIDRLLHHKLLALVNQKHHATVHGGRRMHVYQLGAEARSLYGVRRRNAVVVDYHALQIANVYLALKQAERDKLLKITHYATEPNSHMDVGGIYLKPDLFADLVIRLPDDKGLIRQFFLEIDLGTERQRQVLDQVEAYIAACASGDRFSPSKFPHVLFLATTDERAADIRYWLKSVRGLPMSVEVGTIGQLVELLQRQ